MAIIYCNPIITFKKNLENNPYETKIWKLFMPHLEFCLIASLGIIMILSSFVSDKEEKNENNENAPNKEKEKVD